MHIGSSFQEALSELRVVVTAPTGPSQQCPAITINSGCQPSVVVHGGQDVCRFPSKGLGTELIKLLLAQAPFDPPGIQKNKMNKNQK